MAAKSIKYIYFPPLAPVGSFLTIAMTVICFSGLANAQQGGYILPLQTNTHNIPFFADALKDPAIVRQSLRDEIDADRLAHESSGLANDLQRSQGARQHELLRNLYINHAILANFYQDVSSGRKTSGANAQQIAQKLSQARNETIRYATQYARIEKKNSAKAEALYHALINQYLLGQNRAGVVRQLEGLKQLNPYLSRRANFLVNYHYLQNGSAAQRRSALIEMNKLIGQLPTDGAIAARLITARELAGVSSDGRRVSQPERGYRALLSAAVQRSARFGANLNGQTLNFAASVWIGAEGRHIDWNKPPFSLASNPNHPTIRAIVERSAQQDAKAGQIPSAVRKYDALAAGFAGTPLSLSLDIRKLDLIESVYQKENSILSYEQAILRAKEKYQDNHILGRGQEQVIERARSQLDQRHQKLIDREITVAKRPNASPKQRRETIRITENYTALQVDPRRKEHYTGEIAAVHAINGNHREAVGIYMDLGLNGQERYQIRYLTLAAKSQSVLADWPDIAPWNGVNKGDSAERSRLADVYAAINERQKDQARWPTMSHLGLLQIELGMIDEAFTLWRNAIDKDSRHQDAHLAAGHMLVHHERHQQWDSLESLARIAIAKKLRPTFKRQPVSPIAALANSLFEGGKHSFRERDFAKAVAKLKEFTASFRNDGRRDDGLYHLALSHHGNAEYEEAIAVIGSLVEQYPRTSYMANALYLGGNWANDSAMEEQVIYFHQKFLNDFKSDQRYAVVRDQLSTLYLGRELFVQAAAIHKHEAESRTLSSEERLKHALAWLSIEVRYGSPSRVLVAAKLVDEQASSNDDARAIAIAARIKVYSQQQKFSEVQKSIRELRQLDQASSYVREALGEAMLLLANIESQKWSPDVFNLALRDPLATMNDQYTTYNKVRSMFEAVCSSTESGWCAPAQFQLARFSENAIASFEDFSIPETLASKDIKEFNARKEAILMGIASIAQSADQRAHAGIAQGGIKPEWAQQIIWNNTTDWDTYRITDETGQGYLQWSPALTSGNH